MTTSPLIISIITLIWIGGVYLNKEKQVFQTPAELLGNPNSVVNLSLTHHISSYDTILWYQRSVGDSSLKLIGYMNYKTPNVEKEFEGHFEVSGDGEKTAFLHILNLRHPEDSGEYFGAARLTGGKYEAYFGQGTKLTVLGRKITPPTVTVFKPSSKECRNLKDEKERKKTLLCVARDFYPDHVSMFWQVNAKNVTKGVATDPAAWLDNGTYFITSRLRVLAEVWTTPGTNFSCFVSFFNGNTTIKTNETVFAVEADGSVKTRVTYLRSTQSFKLSYTVLIIKSSIYGAFVAFLVWKLQGSTGKQKY